MYCKGEYCLLYIAYNSINFKLICVVHRHPSFYDSLTGCEATAISEYSMYLSGHCFDVIDPRYGDYSYKFVFPNINVYDGTGCASKHPQQQALPTTCEAADEDDYYGTQVSTKTTEATAAAVVRDVLDRLAVQRRERTDESTNVNSYYYSSSTTELYDVWSQVQSRTAPTAVSKSPSRGPTETPTILPTALPTALATGKPTAQPSLEDQPSPYPSAAPTLTPTTSQRPTVAPSTSTPTTAAPSTAPSVAAPTVAPSLSKTQSPTAFSPLPQPVNLIVTMEVNQVRPYPCVADYLTISLNVSYGPHRRCKVSLRKSSARQDQVPRQCSSTPSRRP